jgi:hypothetical protein
VSSAASTNPIAVGTIAIATMIWALCRNDAQNSACVDPHRHDFASRQSICSLLHVLHNAPRVPAVGRHTDDDRRRRCLIAREVEPILECSPRFVSRERREGKSTRGGATSLVDEHGACELEAAV